MQQSNLTHVTEGHTGHEHRMVETFTVCDHTATYWA